MLELQTGDHFAGCHILGMCGKGGYGTVYLAKDATGKQVAVKIINTTEKERELQGIRNYMMRSKQSPYLLTVYHVGVEQNELFLVMEAADQFSDSTHYLPDTLAKRLQVKGRLSPDKALEIIQKIASAVKTLHDSELIHRDIKPDNIIFVRGEPKLSDPGLICSTDHSISLAGTLGYLPPECFDGTESNSMQSDIYALGKLFYCLITGKSPGKFPYMPDDLDFSLCRKLLPIILKACNTKKKKRYTTIDEFRRDLPVKLSKAGILFRLGENFRIWRLMHYYLWCSILATFIVGFIIGSGIFLHHYQQQKKAEYIRQLEEYHVQRRIFEKRINSDRKYIALQLNELIGQKQTQELLKTYTSLPNSPEKAAGMCRNFSLQLNEFAMLAVEQHAQIPDILRRVAAKRAFLKSPLGAFLTPEQKDTFSKELQKEEQEKKSLFTTSLQLEKTFIPDSSGLFKFNYIPPGSFISTSGKQIRIDYPIWVAPEKLNFRQFARMCRFIPGTDFYHEEKKMAHLESTVVRIVWNDILHGCRSANEMFQSKASFPPGYIVRPLTQEEWEYCAVRSARKSGRFSDGFTVNNMGNDIFEIISSQPGSATNSVLAYLFRDGNIFKKEFAYYASSLQNIGTRIAIAPGNSDYYKDRFITNSSQHLVFNGKHYEFFGQDGISFNRKFAEDICTLLGGRLASMDSPELIEALNRVASSLSRSKICTAANFKDGKWFWSNGKPVQQAPRPPEHNEFFFMFGKRFKLGKLIGARKIFQYDSFICEWTEEEFRARKDWKKRIKHWNPKQFRVKSFKIDGKEYVLFKLTLNYPHLCNRYAELLGGKIAEPETPALQKKIGEQLKDFNNLPTLLGGYSSNGKFYWNSSHKEIQNVWSQPNWSYLKGSLLNVPAIRNGRLYATQASRQFLVEFPAPESAQK